MIVHTASAGITLAEKLENESASFYEALAQLYTKDAETFLFFSKGNKKNIAQIKSVYYGVISDAIEGCFAFNIETDDYTIETRLPENTTYSEALAKAIKMEEKILKFYSVAAEQAKSLMADLPRALMIVAKKRTSRIQILQSLLEKKV